ncbi:MAG: DUF885 domain-containing protein [Candidatus Eisenbacteria bacterium]|uniref:DUF885 domain-containing protein n=1 Tax=Eiseniibacteriota bacterium TaxID=2212470 RepID=A0A538U1R7_UNCEI|nr:MAG: DUF885 domain-containing protein [Candidatus Eisenbacteria bacterium]
MLETVKTFTALSEEFVELYMRHHPVQATLAGIHDYDERLPDDSPNGIRERITWLRDLEQRLVASVPWQELPIEQRVDFGLLRSRLGAMRADLEEVKIQARNPALYPETALTGIFLLMARRHAPLEERKEAVLARLLAVPDYLKIVRPNFEQVPDTYLGIASEITLSAPAFVDEVTRTLVKAFPSEAERIEHAGSRARVGFLQYQEFIDRDLEAKVGGTFAIGERWMNFKLEREHLLAMDCAALDALGREHVEHARKLLEAEAAKIDPVRSWRDLITEAKKRHPEPLRLREAYVAEVARARQFVADQGIAPLPAEESLEVIDTPIFLRATTPYAAYLAPAPFDADPTGYFFVTPVDGARRKEEQAQQLEGHCYAGMPLTTVHEAYPGHHLQLVHANRASSRLRQLADSPMFAEGWALYCEELMHEHGYYLDAVTRLYQLKDLLWRACRVVIDVGLHTGKMTFMQAVDYLVEQAMVERFNALIEVKRYTMTPTQPSSYLVGKLQILGLRDEVQKKLGTGFDLAQFHQQLLGVGTLPLALARDEILSRMA